MASRTGQFIYLIATCAALMASGCASHPHPVAPHMNPDWFEVRPSIEARTPPGYHVSPFVYGYHETQWRPWPVEFISEEVVPPGELGPEPLGEHGFSQDSEPEESGDQPEPAPEPGSAPYNLDEPPPMLGMTPGPVAPFTPASLPPRTVPPMDELPRPLPPPPAISPDTSVSPVAFPPLRTNPGRNRRPLLFGN